MCFFFLLFCWDKKHLQTVNSGRKRTFPHIAGNFPTHVFIPGEKSIIYFSLLFLRLSKLQGLIASSSFFCSSTIFKYRAFGSFCKSCISWEILCSSCCAYEGQNAKVLYISKLKRARSGKSSSLEPLKSFSNQKTSRKNTSVWYWKGNCPSRRVSFDIYSFLFLIKKRKYLKRIGGHLLNFNFVRFSIILKGYHIFVNEERSRTFVSLAVDEGANKVELSSLFLQNLISPFFLFNIGGWAYSRNQWNTWETRTSRLLWGSLLIINLILISKLWCRIQFHMWQFHGLLEMFWAFLELQAPKSSMILEFQFKMWILMNT